MERVAAEATTFGVFGSHFFIYISLLPLLSLACSFSIMERVTAEATALGTVGSVDGGRVSFT